MTGIGPVAVRQPRGAIARRPPPIPTASGSLRRSCRPTCAGSKSIETLLPILYLKGISTGDFSEALAALLGKDAAGLSVEVTNE